MGRLDAGGERGLGNLLESYPFRGEVCRVYLWVYSGDESVASKYLTVKHMFVGVTEANRELEFPEIHSS